MIVDIICVVCEKAEAAKSSKSKGEPQEKEKHASPEVDITVVEQQDQTETAEISDVKPVSLSKPVYFTFSIIC